MKSAAITFKQAELAQLDVWAEGKDVPRHCEFECQCELLLYRNAEYEDGALAEVIYTPTSHDRALVRITKPDGRLVMNDHVPMEYLLAKYTLQSRYGCYELLIERAPEQTYEGR